MPLRNVIIAALLLIVACGIFFQTSSSEASSGAISIRFWNGFTGPDGRTMLKMVKRFNQENPDVHVTMQRMDWGTYYNKLFVAGLGGRAPEVFVVHTDVLPRFSRAHLLRDLDDLIAESNFDPKDVDPAIWNAAQFDGKQVCLPLDVHLMGLYYNKDMLKAAGFFDPATGEAQPPKSRDEFLAIARKLRAGDRWGFTFTWLRTNAYAIMLQYGGKLLSDDGLTCTLNSEENVRALEFCAQLLKDGLVAQPQSMDSWIGFRQGKVAMVFEGIYMLADLERQTGLPYAGAPLPQLGDRPATWAGSHNLCLHKDLKGKELAASWRFIKFLSDNSLDWAAGGQIPVRRSLRETPRFKTMSAQYNFSQQIPYMHYKPRMPFIFEFDTEYDLAVERALRGDVTPRQALDEATVIINKIMKRDREMYEQAEVKP